MKDQVSPSLPLAQMRQDARILIPSMHKQKVTSKLYGIEGSRVLVTWQEFLPTNKSSGNKAIIFFPGWPLRADSDSIRALCEEFARSSGVKTFALHTRNEQVIPNSLYLEAKAVCKFLEESEFNEITLVGYSQGGIKAINTIISLHEINANLHVDGLILIVSVGLNEIDSAELARRYMTDFLIKSSLIIIREVARQPSFRKKLVSLIRNISLAIHSSLEFFISILQEVRASNRHYFERFQNDLKEMTQKSPYLNQIRVPVVLVQGAKDRVSDSRRILSQATDTTALVLSSFDISENLPTCSQNTSQQILAMDIFPQSAHVIMVEANKFGTHVLPLFRSKSVARASLYLLQRASRGLL